MFQNVRYGSMRSLPSKGAGDDVPPAVSNPFPIALHVVRPRNRMRNEAMLLSFQAESAGAEVLLPIIRHDFSIALCSEMRVRAQTGIIIRGVAVS
jgi:hypothetical protein